MTRRLCLGFRSSHNVSQNLFHTPPAIRAIKSPGLPVDGSTAAPPPPPPPPQLPPTPSNSTSVEALAASYRSATGQQHQRALRSRTVLVLFSSPYDRPDGLAAYLARLGLQSVLVDNSADGGGPKDDIRVDSYYESLLQRCHSDDFLAIVAAPPCSIFSVALFRKIKMGLLLQLASLSLAIPDGNLIVAICLAALLLPFNDLRCNHSKHR